MMRKKFNKPAKQELVKVNEQAKQELDKLLQQLFVDKIIKKTDSLTSKIVTMNESLKKIDTDISDISNDVLENKRNTSQINKEICDFKESCKSLKNKLSKYENNYLLEIKNKVNDQMKLELRNSYKIKRRIKKLSDNITKNNENLEKKILKYINDNENKISCKIEKVNKVHLFIYGIQFIMLIAIIIKLFL